MADPLYDHARSPKASLKKGATREIAGDEYEYRGRHRSDKDRESVSEDDEADAREADQAWEKGGKKGPAPTSYDLTDGPERGIWRLRAKPTS